MDENAISFQVRKAAFAVHSALGPGLLEGVYEIALAHELRDAGLLVQTQVAICLQRPTAGSRMPA